MRRCLADPGDPLDQIDIYDDKNWIVRGFNLRWQFAPLPVEKWIKFKNEELREPMAYNQEFDGLKFELHFFLTLLFHLTWVYSLETDDAPLAPEEKMKQALKDMSDIRKLTAADIAALSSKFKRVPHPEWGWAWENEWLTKKWLWMKKAVQIGLPIMTYLLGDAPIDPNPTVCIPV
jgi:hypothetical protein